MGHTILASTVRALVRFGERRGLDRSELLTVVGIDEATLDVSDGRVARESYDALWREMDQCLGDPEIGLAHAESDVLDGAYGVVGFLAMTSATAGESIARVVGFHSLLKEDAEVHLLPRGHDLVLEQLPRAGVAPWSRPVIEHALASWAVLGRRWTGGDFAAKEVRFQHARPRDVSSYERVFGCPVRFDQPVNAIHFPREALALRLSTSQPALATYLESLARAQLQKRTPGDLAATVREAVRDALAEGDVDLPRIARRLGVSTRTLQRRLDVQGLVFRNLVDEVRRHEAIELLEWSNLPLTAVGEKLGYSEAKAFRRAFRRWTGMAPADWRRGRERAATPAF
ncbi:Transcriptional regulator, AraC family protein [Minicystis rosea]|nr:Transcriptional regulator, AraC family protein [Minicystis rosea]